MTDDVRRSRERGQAAPSAGGREGSVGEAAVREVTLRELDRSVAAVIGSLRDGERVVLTRRGSPVAVILSLADTLELTGWPETDGDRPLLTPFAVRGLLREALGKVVGDELERRLWRREVDRYVHGRWYEPRHSRT